MTRSEEERTPKFLEAVKKGDVAAVQAFLESDSALANARDEAGRSPVLLAIYYGQAKVRDLLLESGVSLDIFEAAAGGREDRVAVLLSEEPARANAYAPDGFTPLGLASFFGHLEVVDVLLKQGADVNAVSRNATGYTALTGAVAGGHQKIVAALLSQGARPDHRYAQGYTALHEAAAGGKWAIAMLLLNHGADPQARTEDGKTPLALALEKGHQGIADLLREHGAAE